MDFLALIEDTLWSWIGFPLLMGLGLYFTFATRALQIRAFPKAMKTFIRFLTVDSSDERGVHPLKAFFACIGGCVGIGNLVAVCTAVQLGGPGALLWIWITALLGMILKYSEVFIGFKHRIKNRFGSYDGGPMYFLKAATGSRAIAALSAILLAIYGVEIYQFNIMAHTLADTLNLDLLWVVLGLIAFTLYVCQGGVKRVGEFSSALIPFFIVIYIGMGFWVLGNHLGEIPAVLGSVFSTAFTGTAAVGGFAGSTLMLTISEGVSRGCYSTDVGVGYASVIHCESTAEQAKYQASLTFVDIFLDTFVICTMSVMLVLVTGVWKVQMPAEQLIQVALGAHLPYVGIFMPLFIILLTFSTVTAYFVVGTKCARYLSPKWGEQIFILYGIAAFFVFSFVSSRQALTVMALTQAGLLALNCLGMFLLRREVTAEIE